MSLNLALSSALSGLTAASRNASVVSENIANALTPGYARRTLELTSQGDVVPGVLIAGIQRHVDPAITANRREADAQLSNAQLISDFRSRLADAIGSPDDPVSLTSRLAAFSESLISAASRPESAERLDTAVLRAGDLTNYLNDASKDVQNMRSEADRKIGIQVDRLNTLLKQVEDLNVRVVSSDKNGGETASLLDQRQRAIDELNEIVPVNIVNREFGRVALYTDGGTILVDSSAIQLNFTPSNTVTAVMSLAGGSLSGLDTGTYALRTDSSNSDIPGGSLAALFAIRDEYGVAAQADLDSVARDLIERFEDPALDATRAPGAPGLFTDNGAALDPLLEVGLAGRLSVNANVDPLQGGTTWRLRDGLGAVVPGPPGDARLLQALQGALDVGRSLSSGSFGTGLQSASDVTAALESRFAQSANVADQRLTFAAASQQEMSRIELTQGVDSDAELSRLILVEQAYAANARMFEVVDDLMETLLRI